MTLSDELRFLLMRLARGIEDLVGADTPTDELWTCERCGCTTNFYLSDICKICENKKVL